LENSNKTDINTKQNNKLKEIHADKVKLDFFQKNHAESQAKVKKNIEQDPMKFAFFKRTNADLKAKAKQVIEKDPVKFALYKSANANVQAKIKFSMNSSELEEMRSKNRNVKNNKSYESYEHNYFQNINDTCTNVCCSCGGLWFKLSVIFYEVEVLKQKILNKKGLNFDIIYLNKFFVDYCHLDLRTCNLICLCSTCRKYIFKLEIPPRNLALGLRFPALPECLSILNHLERIFVSPRIPFMKIVGLGNYGLVSSQTGQLGLNGSVVNVPVSVDNMVSMLPRQMSDTQTIQIKLMRQMKLKTPYIYETVRPGLIYNAVVFLSKTPLYKDHNITISSSWLDQFENINETIYNVNDSSEESEDEPLSEIIKDQTNKNTNDKDDPDISSSDLSNSHDESSEDESNSSFQKRFKKKTKKFRKQTDVEKEHANTDTLLDNRDPSDIAIKFAPGENHIPASLIYDTNCEELSFPAIYCGQKITDKVSYNDRINSELRMYDPRGCVSDKIFFNYKMGQNIRINNAINICLRKKTSNHTSSDLLRDEYISNLISTDSGYKFLECERNSPPYLQKIGKNIKAFVRQEGIPAFFMTFTAAETKWAPLLISLMKRSKNRIITSEEALALPYHEKSELIRNDPVTCARYFDMRIRQLIAIMKRRDGIFKDNNLIDYEIRIEFQNRGSPHAHGIYWLDGVPKYIKGDKKSHDLCVEFIDKYITYKYDESIAELITYQNHKHSFTCYKQNKGKRDNMKKKKKICGFHFPRFPMLLTCILEPFGEYDQVDLNLCKQRLSFIQENLVKRLVKKLNKVTKIREKDLSDTIEVFLEKLNLNYEDYINAIRSSLKDATVFLKRNLNEILINNYNLKLFKLVGSNMDIQFILNIWSCVEYIVNYVSKSEKHMSKTLMDCVKSLKQGDYTIKERLRKVANSFLYATETSAQECVYIELGLNVTFSSRSFQFINTSLA
jgi:hypothetical protein